MTDKDNELMREIRSPDENAAPTTEDLIDDAAEAKAKPPEFLLPHDEVE